MRAILSNLITQNHYDNYSNVYKNLKSEIVNLKERKSNIEENIKTLLKQKMLLKKAAKNETKNGNRDLELIKSQFTKIKEGNNQIKLSKNELITITVIDLKNSLENIQEFKFMKNINSLEDFKTVIRSKNYWADSFAISLLEYALNIKTIILSKKSHLKKDRENLVSCSDMVLDEIEKNKDFKPKYFIIIIHDLDGNHYQLVSYKSKQIFTFYEIHYVIKENVVDICMKNENGLFNQLPLFVSFKNVMPSIRETIEIVSKTNSLLKKII